MSMHKHPEYGGGGLATLLIMGVAVGLFWQMVAVDLGLRCASRALEFSAQRFEVQGVWDLSCTITLRDGRILVFDKQMVRQS